MKPVRPVEKRDEDAAVQEDRTGPHGRGRP
jgi:hypothetical protein